MKYTATKQHVLNRGTPPDSFLDELVAWGRTAPEEIFAVNATPVDVYTVLRPQLGPWTGILHRRAVMLEALRVLALFESSGNWNEGVDKSKRMNLRHLAGQETGAWQVSYDSLPFGADLKTLTTQHCGDGFTVQDFVDQMKSDHPFAMEYIARLLRHTVKANGPVLRREINDWVRRDAVAEFETLLA